MSTPLSFIVLGFWALETVFVLLFLFSEYKATNSRRTLALKMCASLTYLGYAFALFAFTGDRQISFRLGLLAMILAVVADFNSGSVAVLRQKGPSRNPKLRRFLALLTGFLFIGHMVCLGLAFFFAMRAAGIDPGWRFWIIVCLPIPPTIALDVTLDLKIVSRLAHAPLLILPVLINVAVIIMSIAMVMENGIYRLAFDPFGGMSAVLGILFYVYSAAMFAIRSTENKMYQTFRVWAIAFAFYYIAQMALAGSFLGFGGFGELLLK